MLGGTSGAGKCTAWAANIRMNQHFLDPFLLVYTQALSKYKT